MRAILSNYGQSPRKVGLVAGLIRGKRVDRALVELSFLNKRAAAPVKKLLLSALANTKGAKKEDLYVTEITVGKGITMKRFQPASRGSAHPIRKRRSHIQIVLGEKKTEKKGREGTKNLK